MTFRVSTLLFSISVTVVALHVSVVCGDPSPDPINGHYYEKVELPITWDEARFDAKSREFAGIAGHLATISDAEENTIIQTLGSVGEVWIGLTDSTAVSALDGADLSLLGTFEAGNTSALPLPLEGISPVLGERGAGFRWVTGEPYLYLNWRAGAPGDFAGQADGVHTLAQGVWQDAPAGETVGQPGFAGPASRRYVVEYDIELPQERFHVIERYPAADFNAGQIQSLAIADMLLAADDDAPSVVREEVYEAYVISLHDPDLGGGLRDYVRAPYGGNIPGTNDDDFAIQVNAQVFIPTAGDWTFAHATGDDARLSVGRNTFFGEGVEPDGPIRLTRPDEGELTAVPGGSGATFYFPAAGAYELQLTTFESDFFGFTQLFAAPGALSEFDPALFKLVGDVLNDGLAVVSVGDYDDNGRLTSADINSLTTAIASGSGESEFDLNGDELIDLADHTFWVSQLKRTWLGDADLNGQFDTDDLILVFQINLYETGAPAGWQEGDWNGDQVFGTGDLLAAFQDGGFLAGPYFAASAAVIPEPTGFAMCIVGSLVLAGVRRRSR
ncbi:MAG: hypothetical protein KDB23_03495 [Planctomycetales bacterium]|nr:hypothetical protein [Planctomycetales bacterium]